MKTFLFVIASLGLFGCAADDTDVGYERGPLGKADAIGSCEVDTCGGPAAIGRCWCDDACAGYGDCCSNKADTCDAEEDEPTDTDTDTDTSDNNDEDECGLDLLGPACDDIDS